MTNAHATCNTNGITIQQTDYTPSDITPIDLSLLGKMQDCQRRMYMLIVGRSELGLWTDYDTAYKNGVGAPAKRIQELLKIDGTNLVRSKKGRYVRWCV